MSNWCGIGESNTTSQTESWILSSVDCVVFSFVIKYLNTKCAKSSTSPSRLSTDRSVPTFTVAELAPTYHDGVNGSILGCPHYSRACKSMLVSKTTYLPYKYLVRIH